MDVGLLLPTPLSARAYLIYQALGSTLVNAAINFGSWFVRRDLTRGVVRPLEPATG